MKTNPMLRALDNKIAEIIKRKTELEGQLEVLRATRKELEQLVRRRTKPTVTPAQNAA